MGQTTVHVDLGGRTVQAEIEDVGDGTVRLVGGDWAVRVRIEPRYALRLARFFSEFARRRTDPPETKGGE